LFRPEIISASQGMASFLDRLKRTETTALKSATRHWSQLRTACSKSNRILSIPYRIVFTKTCPAQNEF
jgi:hypothetical protein